MWRTAGLPVRCFQIDAAVSEVLALQPQSPAVRKERKRKQEHWQNIQRHVVQDWATSLQRRRDAAAAAAMRANQELQLVGEAAVAAATVAAAGGALAPVPVQMPVAVPGMNLAGMHAQLAAMQSMNSGMHPAPRTLMR
jgi:hypothetical protein